MNCGITGGGAKSATVRQVVSDLFGLPVVGFKTGEGAALGAAIQAAWTYGQTRGDPMPLEKIVKSAVKTDRKTRAEPRKENANHLCGIAWTACRSHAETGKQRVSMKIVIGATGASGSIYLQRLLEQINASEHEVHLVMTVHARQVADHELLTFRLPPKVLQHRRQRYERSIRQRLCPFRRDGNCALLDVHARSNCHWFGPGRAPARR